MNPWLLGGGVLALMLLTGKKAEAAIITPFPGKTARSRDLDALADMLITETNFTKGKQEMAQIIYVAINRAKRYNLPLYVVVDPDRRAFPAWNPGSGYKRRFVAASTNKRWTAARDFAASVLSGAYSNMGKRSFVHPAAPGFNMPCNTHGGKWAPTHVPGYGTRCIPLWAHGGKVVGTGLFA